MSRQAMPVSEKSGGVQSYSTVQARKIDRRREPTILRITSGTPNCTRDSQEEQWATAIELIRQTSKWFVEARDTKACWNLLAKLFDFPFFELLKLTAPYTLQGRPSREASVAKNRLIQDLPEEAQQELRKFEETLKVHSELVDSHKAAARLAAKRKLLIFGGRVRGERGEA
ncbi:hypothetical protein DAPPUDRAFT_322879 [Daphnia pulex]|uniref:Uncharacterized protein n=1 Tax=Daphnia pulex TaxID=6669 RepID=E9GX72_DAPPU|nr:hypothetical protein DAPPUDRAFT_322879 [Daphnia pulex]|eukprot:EFX75912.1 hypothetical protein DAPPUDRAFT_322879 [Daphnia pulex]